jgi:hypothetical protein
LQVLPGKKAVVSGMANLDNRQILANFLLQSLIPLDIETAN